MNQRHLFEGAQLRALSLTRPWIWAILEGGKRVENRDWKPPAWIIGQYIALHAAKSWESEALLTIEWALRFNGIKKQCPPEKRQHLDSMIVGLARVVDFVTDGDRDTLPRDQRPWYMGTYGWILDDVQALPQPIPCKGALSLWRVPPESMVSVLVQFPELEAL